MLDGAGVKLPHCAGIIRAAADPDYTKRPEPAQIVEVLRAL
jgi:hypothetical protein